MTKKDTICSRSWCLKLLPGLTTLMTTPSETTAPRCWKNLSRNCTLYWTSLCRYALIFGGQFPLDQDISGHLWTSLDLWILRLAASWLRVGQVAGRDGTPQKLGPHLVRSLRGLPHTAKDKSCQEKEVKRSIMKCGNCGNVT